MNAKAFAAVLYLGLICSAAPSAPTIKLHAFRPLDYPAMAKMARIQGPVLIRGRLKKGESWEYRVDKYVVESGHPMLAEPAVQNLKQQWFYCEDCKSLDGAEYEITYEFRLDKDCLAEQQCFKRSSSFRSGHVLVEAESPIVNIDVQTIKSKTKSKSK